MFLLFFLANKRKKAKLLWLQNPNDLPTEYFTNIRRHTYRAFRKKKKDYKKVEVNMLAENSKNKNIREMYKEINELKKEQSISVLL